VSSGAVVALLTASRRPGYVRSLVAVEPSLFTLAPDSPAVRVHLEKIQPTHDKARAGRLSLREFVREITSAVGVPATMRNNGSTA
jgi:pimeloyl-ACP methyl ester carboxylesterase